MRAEAPLLPEEKPFIPFQMRITDRDYPYVITASPYAYNAARNIIPPVYRPNFNITCRNLSDKYSHADARFSEEHPIENSVANINFNPDAISFFFTRNIESKDHFNPKEGLIFYRDYSNLPPEARIAFIRKNMDLLYVHELDHLENVYAKRWEREVQKISEMDMKQEENMKRHLLLQLMNLTTGLYDAASSPIQHLELILSVHLMIGGLFLFDARKRAKDIEQEDYYNAPWEIKARQKVADMVQKGKYPGFFEVEIAQ